MQRQAYNLLPLINELPTRLECMAKAGNMLFVGGSDGRISAFSIDRTRDGLAARPAGQKQVSRGKRIEQIEAIPEIGRLLVLSDGQFSVHSLTDLEMIPSAASMKGVKCFCVNQRGPPGFKLALAVKRKLLLFENSGSQYQFVRELALSDVPTALLWYNSSVIVGYRKDYWIVNDSSGDHTNYGGLSIDTNKTTPLAVLLPGEEVLVAAMDRVGVFLNFNGEPLAKSSINWSNSPSQVVFHFQSLISMSAARGLEVHNFKDQSLTQNINVKGIMAVLSTSLTWQATPRSLNDPESMILVGTSSSVYALELAPLEQQIDDLLRVAKVDEAMEILNISIDPRMREEDRRRKMMQFHRKAGLALLSNLRFDESMSYLAQAEVDPRELIAFFPELQSSRFNYRPAVLDPRTIPYGTSPRPDMASVITEIQLKNSWREPSQRELLANAKIALTTFLENQGERGRRDRDTASAVDTALFRLYIGQGRRREVEQMISADAAIDVDDCVPFLTSARMYGALGLLFKSKGQLRDALEVWARIGSGEYQEPGSDGITPTIEVLSMNKGDDLLWQYSTWVLRANPDKGLQIFGNPKRDTPLDPDRVLEHLRSFQDPTISQRYLEALVFDQKIQDNRYHTRLALDYIQEISELIARQGNNRKPLSAVNIKYETGRLAVVRQKLVEFIKKTSLYDVNMLMEKTRSLHLVAEYVNLCSKSGRHMEAINILLYEIGDHHAAEVYCQQFGGPERIGDSRYHDNPLFLNLLEAYLNPLDTSMKAPYRDHALNLLRTHAKKINSIKVLELLPPDIRLSELSEYFAQVLPNSSYRVRDAMVVHNLWKNQCLQTACERAQAFSKYVEVTSDTRCQYDGKKIGDTIFAQYPNGTIVRYKYINGDLTTDPVTGMKFSSPEPK